jgi:hypothetical protein
MKKLFYLLFLTILIAKAFPDEGEKDDKHSRFSFYFAPEIVTTELGVDTTWGGYWKSNVLNLHFLFWFAIAPSSDYIFDFEITPAIISKNLNMPSYNFSFVNLKISYILTHDSWLVCVKPFLEINYLNLKDKIFDYNTLNLQAGVRFGILSMLFKDVIYFETGYSYKNKNDNYFFTIGISLFWTAPPFPGV